jgi:hypothetical protein
MTGRDPGPRYTETVRRQAVEIMGRPITLDETLPPGTFALRDPGGKLLGQWQTTTVEHDPAVAAHVVKLLLETDAVPYSGPGDPPAGTNLVGFGGLEHHRRAGDVVEPLPPAEIHRPRLRQLADHLWVDVDEIIALETRCDGDLGWPERRVIITTRGGDRHSVIVPGTMRDELTADGMDAAAYDAAADQALARWLAERFGDIIGADELALADIAERFGLVP